MASQSEIPTFCYNAKDFNFTIKSNVKNDSALDSMLHQTWKQAEKVGAFRYNLNIRSSKTLRGRYRFLAQFNPERGHCRRTPESITSMQQPFDPARFNFTKLPQKEILFDVGNGDLNDVVAINSSPLESRHCLLLSERLKCLPQVITEYSLLKAIELCLLSSSWSLRIVFNSLCAYASVNHLHWHLYYLRYEMLLEYINICDYIKGVHLLVDYPARGFCLKLSDFKDITDFVSRTICLVNYLQSREIPHNVCITRAKSKPGDEFYNDVRIYIWARKPSGAKNTILCHPAVCEFLGHLSIRDEDAYNNLTEDDVVYDLNEATEEYFLLMKNELRSVLNEQ